ncbi:MAG: excinuclease ABC subunit UvrC [Bacilli bacterium]|nr:excinuclease ABC subunit UvrC [Bacilli bacterium]
MNEEVKKHIKEKLSLVPNLPGSYQMKNKDGMIIYVGKAKNLKNRLKSYFTGNVTGKTAMLVNDIRTFEYIVTSSELESLILEITLIKKYNPKYNILLKDDKSYPYIELSNDKYPTVKVVRNINRKKNKNKLFGPYPNVFAARRTVEIINRMYPLRKCANLKKDVCLYYHLGECLGYCKYKDVDQEKISKMKDEITAFLKGDAEIITKKIEEDMYKASEALNFEKAKSLKEMLDDINITLKRQKLDLNKKYNFDMFAYYKNNNYLSVQVFFIRDGLLFGRHKDIFTIVDDEKEEIIEYIIKFYEKDNLLPNEIMINDEVDSRLLEEYLNIKVNTPKKGDLKKLLDLATDNAKVALVEEEETLKQNDEARIKAKEELEKALNLSNINRIEAFDNSHLFGTFYVGGMVVFDDFIANKDLYRKYKISTDVKDDLSAMREVLYRRYYKVAMDEEEAPDLIVIDGGELQINVANEILNSLNLNIPIIGLKKDDKHRTNTIIDKELNVINIDNKSNLFLFLTKIQDEVHRFAISYHRNIKSKGMLSSILDFVPGIGEKRKKELLKRFGSLKKMKEASLQELEETVNKDVANKLYQYLKEL